MKKILICLICLAPILCKGQNMDSLINVRQEYVWGDVKFGADYATYYKAAGDATVIGKYSYTFDPKVSSQHKVIGLELISDSVGKDKYHDIIVYQLTNLCDIIKMQYGASNVDRTFPADAGFIKPDEKYIYKKWNVGTKKIIVGVTRSSEDTYIVYCNIYSDAMMKEEHAKENQRLKEDAGKF